MSLREEARVAGADFINLIMGCDYVKAQEQDPSKITGEGCISPSHSPGMQNKEATLSK